MAERTSCVSLKLSSSEDETRGDKSPSTNPPYQYYKDPLDLQVEVQYLLEPIVHSRKQLAIVSFVHNVSPVIQKGPMCGIVALSMASQLVSLGKGSSRAQVVPWQPQDAHPEALLQFAKDGSLTKQGEMFSAEYMAQVASTALRCSSKVIDINSLSPCDLILSVLSREAILIPYDADKDHSPCLANGHKSHWCLVVGFAVALPDQDASSSLLMGSSVPNPSLPRHYSLQDEHNIPSVISKMKEQCGDPEVEEDSTHSTQSLEVHEDSLYLFSRHGKSRHIGLWSFEEMKRSNLNLIDVGPRRRESEYVVPPGGIAQGLRSKVVIAKHCHNYT